MPRIVADSRILLVLAITAWACAELGPRKPAEASLAPGYTTTRTGQVHDFDYFAGGWTTHQRR
ncbi:MAG TPA: hypothetical protein VFX42_04470 [Gemmatimonadales bacterium]|nr:hypothetical protein [Gemmatimonadales bacterium]